MISNKFKLSEDLKSGAANLHTLKLTFFFTLSYNFLAALVLELCIVIIVGSDHFWMNPESRGSSHLFDLFD